MNSLSTYRHIIWDWNGTLLNDAWLCIDVMNGMLSARGLPTMTPERYQEEFDFPVIEYYRRLGYDFEKESFEELGTEFIQTYESRRNECVLQNGAHYVLKRIHEEGCSQSVLSAYQQSSLLEAVEHYRVADCFDAVVGISDHYADGKVGQGMRHLERVGHASNEVVLIGDTTHDFEVAEAMGVDCILISCGNHSRARLEGCGVPVVESLTALAV